MPEIDAVSNTEPYAASNLIKVDRMDAKAVGIGLLLDEHFSKMIEGHTNDISTLYDHQHLLADIKRELTQLEEVDEDGNLVIPQDLEEKIRFYYNEFLPQAQRILNMDENHDPLLAFKNPNHPAFQSIADISKGAEQKGSILTLKKEDVDGAILGLEDLRANRIMNKIQAIMMDSQTCQKNSEVIFYMLMMIMSRDELKSFIDGQRVH
jgi:hypothetical protein